jgi:hypothetical protein
VFGKQVFEGGESIGCDIEVRQFNKGKKFPKAL